MLGASATQAAPGSDTARQAKRCPKGSIHAVIRGRHACLKQGQRCNKRRDRDYHRYKFHCHTGRLARAAKKKPPKPAELGKIVARVPLSGDATDLAIGFDSVWVRVESGGGTGGRVERIDPGSNTVAAGVGVPEAGRLTTGEGAVWAPNFSSKTVTRIDPAGPRVVATISLAAYGPSMFPYDAVTTPGAVWVTNKPQAEHPTFGVIRISPATNTPIAAIPYAEDSGVGAITFGAGSLWAIAPARGLLRIDPATSSVTAVIPINMGACGDIAADAAAVWSGSSNCGSLQGLVRLDPATNRSVARIVRGSSVFGRPEDVALGLDAVWTTLPRQGHALLRIDPATNRITGTRNLPEAIARVDVGFGAVWVAVGKELLRIEP